MKPSSSTELVLAILTSVLGSVLISAGNVILGIAAPTLPKSDGDLASGVAIAFLLFVVYILITRRRAPQEPRLLVVTRRNLDRGQALAKPNRWTYAIVAGVSIFIIVGIGVYSRWVLIERRTMYFIVDASEGSPTTFRELASRIKITTLPVPPETEIGLEAFGGGYSANSGCDDVVELVAPTPKAEAIEKISDALALLDQDSPKGFSGIQHATEYALKQLANRRDTQQIWILVTRLDTRCGELDRNEIDRIAAENNVKYELVIITVGPVSEADQRVLSAFAGRYIYAQTADEIPIIIQQQSRIPPVLYDLYRKVYGSYGP